MIRCGIRLFVKSPADRRDRGGFTPSGRVWRTAEQAREHIETSLAEGLAEGRSAAELSRTIREDLREPERLYRRVRDKNGILELSKPARAYHPGAGVCRSSYKNALRLTRTEINVSYAEADFERWQRLDFVIGYEVRLSNNHTCNGHPFTDICDELAGKYPKWFKFTKWHPQCRCVCLAIFDDDPGAGEVRDVPPNFKQWVTDNQPRLDRSLKKGTAPYWVRDNFSKQGKLTGAGSKPPKPGTLGGGSKPPKPPHDTPPPAPDDRENNRQRFLSYDKETWEQTHFYPDTGGYVVRDRSRIEKGTINKQERYKLEKETRMCHVFARAGHRIELLKEIPRIPSPDVTLDDIPADLKSLKGANNILREAKSATEKQGAKLVLYEFEKVDTKVIQALARLKRKGIPVMYYEKGVDEVIVP